MKNKMQIAIDGPASAGKSTVAKILAKKLGYVYCDTGAMYRALTYMALMNKVSLADEKRLVSLLDEMTISFRQEADGQRVLVNHQDVTDEIREANVSQNVSEVSAHSGVREALVRQQQEIAAQSDIVMDGRDIGTIVLPNAPVKIFLIASVAERAQRRYEENKAKGMTVELEQIKKEIEERDYKDTTRKVSPLVKAKDAIELDTTGLSIEQVVEKIEQIIQKHDFFQ
ncbi:(d)CMP kinase [Vagococcus lutrae]|uniref:Cytidylate kinase n=1 Tax=Vagococcus lutrae TaxID=81947 RepID=A0AAE9XLE4_9ENTE|nr:(d)CMP kinase [Vagococcus lutrae]MDT2801031.1 (d)CMP kinase [Vagococcus lutrae]MDT2825202.1 (d)CMP kinase [Vagococcus lutrae]MDT2841581.1 (d)CMP kinase [Vagococcus lutrae]WCG22088.1 (d)CMP kinase [Vagococcus lutrae]